MNAAIGPAVERRDNRGNHIKLSISVTAVPFVSLSRALLVRL